MFSPQANMSSDLPGEWQEDTFTATDLETDGLVHSMKHTFNGLQPATDYHAAIQVKNKFKWSADTEYAFSTKKGECVSLGGCFVFFLQHSGTLTTRIYFVSR